MLISIYPEDFEADIQKIINDCIANALKIQKQPDYIEVEVMFVEDEEIREINRENRNVDKVTDVLSFPSLDIEFGEIIDKDKFKAEIDYETGNIMLGSIVICLDQAKRQAEEYNHSLKREVAYLTVHGILHLLGYDHMEEDEKAVMREREEAILNTLGYTRDN